MKPNPHVSIYDKSTINEEMAPDGTKPLSEPMLTEICGAICR